MSQNIMLKIVQTTGDLPTMSHMTSLIMEKLGNPSTSAQQLNEVISKDQALAARVLKIANSAFYGCPRTVTRLSDAVVMMGFSSIRSLVMASAVRDFFKRTGFAEKLLWEHSLACGSIAKIIAKSIRFSKNEEAFLGGLLHDIGKVVLNLKLPDQTLKIVQEVYNNPGVTFYEMEQDEFGFDHAQVGELVARKWNFAEEIVEVIGNHHQPEKSRILPHLSFIVNLANGFCHKLSIGPIRNPDLDLAEMGSAKFLNLKSDKINNLLDEVSSLMKSDQSLFSM
jgi:putative nucleotidyltransferase with HDIG domain